ncbi:MULTISPECIES: GNAT family N-acetyltransferase [Vibrio]|uniref:GNAT family N-acetyltransferase n=1 Tax=Vibrio TaxID=662 RepID=UPI001EEF1477|nr:MULTISPECIES: N-acetyltransferase [Vibrio]MDF4652781.1 N-acetyltransferase [Vibrio parahaemolyticus]MDW1845468.1 N-acetyltransferase [Vibrio sp. Vb2130]MDW1879585.1 N-acetyltransferase [Vibrio sp. Vb2110]MDW1899599.1 N-acetyltransferase [Vibrio sp. Vb1337]MDW1958410.1 N-acetyltransferase [Vibrio sp. 661]
MDILSAQKEDLFAIYKLENTLFGEHAYPQFFFRQAFDCWGESLLVAKEGEQVAGYILLTTSTNAHQYWIMSLAVDIQHRGKGIARSLLENVIEPLTLGSSVKLTVDPKNQPALSLYLSLGFKTLEEEAHYFGDEESRLVMELVK